MSWFGRDSPLRSSFSRRKTFTPLQKVHEGACLEVFKTHWQQAWSIIEKDRPIGQPNPTQVDDISTVVNLLEQMTNLILQEALQHQRGTDPTAQGEVKELDAMGPILNYFLMEGCLDKLLNWSAKTGEFASVMKLEQLKLYEVLVSNCHRDLLFHKPVVRPLLRLLSSCKECSPVEVEKRLVILLNALCVCLTQCPDLLQVFFHASSDQGATRSGNSCDMFLIFSLLIPFVHREGSIGQQARDALLLCMSLSRRNENIGIYIAEHSNFCPVLATGLSGLYSVLPRKLAIVSEDWHCFTPDDITEMPELSMFLNSLEFCNAVIQVAHSMVQEQLLEYLYQGFLLPVLGPALYQNTVDEIIATTAYLELFLRTVTEPILLQVFLKFILTSTHDNHSILNTLIDRLGAQGRLCLVTMALFHQLLNLNCEDVLFQLVFRYLVPCSHIMVSQRSRIRDTDIYGYSATKFLSLIPVYRNQSTSASLDSNRASPTNTPSHPIVPGELHSISVSEKLYRGGSLRIKRHQRSTSTSSFAYGDLEESAYGNQRAKENFELQSAETYQSNYLDYVKAAHKSIKICTVACRVWSAPYNGCDPPPDCPKLSKQESQESKNTVIVNGFGHVTQAVRRKSKDSLKAKELFVQKRLSKNSDNALGPLTIEPLTVDAPTSEGSSISGSQNSSPNDQNAFTCKYSVFSENKEILNQLIHAEDENAFWKLIGSTKTPSSVSDLDDSLDNMDISFAKETEIVSIKDEKPNFDNDTCKDEGSNLDSGVFESRESNSSSDKDIEPEPPSTNGAKTKASKTTHTFGANYLPKRDRNPPTQLSNRESFGTPDVGPFLSILLTRLEMMMQNDVYTNLHLTGLIARLAIYPQPLLRSFLLDHSLVFQPTVRSLLQVLGSLKHKVDSYACTLEDFDDLVARSRHFLLAREDCFLKTGAKRAVSHSLRSSRPSIAFEIQRGEPRRRSITNFLFRRSSFLRGKALITSREPSLETISDGQGYRYVTKPNPDAFEGEMESLKTKNAVLCAVVLEEFLKELAAIVQEHSVIQLDPDFWDRNS